MYMSFLDASMTYSCGIHAEEQKGDLQVGLPEQLAFCGAGFSLETTIYT
jgi:hypothetical protein